MLQLQDQNISSKLIRKVDTFTEEYYHAITRDLNINPQTFQLVQGCMPLGSDPDCLWEIFDSIPPLSINHFYNPSQHNSFSTDYGAVINNLMPYNPSQLHNFFINYSAVVNNLMPYNPSQLHNFFISCDESSNKLLGKENNGFEDVMDLYLQLKDFTESGSFPVTPKGQNLGYFHGRMSGLSQDEAKEALKELEVSINFPVVEAIKKWNDAGGSFTPKAYDGSIEELIEKLRSAPKARVTFRCARESSNVSESWAKGRVSQTSFSTLSNAHSTKLAASAQNLIGTLLNSNTITTITFQHIIEFMAPPLSEPSADLDFDKFKPWYHHPALKLAFKNNSNSVWKEAAPTWENTFGESGNMKRICYSVIVADGMSTKISGPSVTKDTFQPEALDIVVRNLFNFVSPLTQRQRDTNDQKKGLSVEVKMDAEDTISVTTPLENPFIIGVNVKSIESFLGIHNKIIR